MIHIIKFNLLLAICVTLTIFLGSSFHLMYGSCQTSKWHYMTQVYYMDDYLPRWMIPSSRIVKAVTVTYIKIKPYDGYSGIWRAWYENGRLESKAGYLNGRKHGKSYAWDSEGERSYQAELVDGKVVGEYKEWHSNGSIKYIWNYRDNKKEGHCTTWDYNYKIKSKSFWINGMQNGEDTHWFSNGKILQKANWKFGKMNGKSVVRYDNYANSIEFVEYFKNDLLLSHVGYNEDGTLKVKEYYDDKGNFQKRELFEKGKLVKTETEE